MWVFWVVFSASAYGDAVFWNSPNESAYYGASLVVTSVSIFVWFLLDARSIGHKPSVGLKIAVVGLALIAVPYYLIRYKGWRRAGLSFFRFLGFLCFFLLFVLIVVPYPSSFGGGAESAAGVASG